MTKPIIPSTADVIGPALVELVAHRPRAFQYVNWGEGAYSLIFAGLRAQAEIAIAAMADAVVARSLMASGDALLAYAKSEYAVPPTLGRTKAVGSLTLTRSAGTKPAGVIRKGHKFRRDAEPLATVAIGAAQYEAAADVPLTAGQTTVSVPLVASSDGASSNTPYLSPSPYKSLVSVDALFDANLLPSTYDAGGGSNGLGDEDIRRFARAYTTAQNGPTSGALAVAALGAMGVKYVLIDDTSGNVYVADASWGSSAAWLGMVQQAMNDSGYIGFGAKVTVLPLPNTLVQASLTVRLRDPSFLSDTMALDAAIKTSMRSYFDDRADFNVYGTQPLRGIVSRAHKRILRCTTAAITDLTGAPLTYASGFYGHLYLSDNAVSITFQGPI